MHKKQQKILQQIFDDPVRADMKWSDIENLLVSFWAEVSEGRGLRVRIFLNGVRALFHRPHPEKECDKGALEAMIRFLQEAGVEHHAEF